MAADGLARIRPVAVRQEGPERLSGPLGPSGPTQGRGARRTPPVASVARRPFVVSDPVDVALIRAIAAGDHRMQAGALASLTPSLAKRRLARLYIRHQIPSSQAALVALAARSGLLLGVDVGPWRDVRLAERQRQVLRMVRSGLDNAAIGAQLGVSENTIKSTLWRVFTLIGAKTRAHAVALDWRWHYSQEAVR